jgi:hypothetical protein
MGAVTPAVAKTGTATWRYDWAGQGTPPYRIVRDGFTAVLTTTDTEYSVSGDDAYEPPVIEVLDSTETESPSEATPPYIDIQWRGHSNAATYIIERWDGAEWDFVEEVTEVGQGYYQWSTEAVDDATAHRYRVVVVDRVGNESAAVEANVSLIRIPPPPRIQMAYDEGTGLVTVSARA